MFGGGSSSPPPPPPPAPPPNPPSYATVATMGPTTNVRRLGGALGDSILTGPLGAPDQNRAQRKSLLGQ